MTDEQIAREIVAKYRATPKHLLLASIAAALATARREGFDACKEQAAEVADKHASSWNAELWERRSWGGPTIGADECIQKEKASRDIATAIRALEPKT